MKYRYTKKKEEKYSIIRPSKKRYYTALDGVSFSVDKGKIVGIIGKNGCGKSTLLRTLAGVYSADEGIIQIHSDSVSLMAIGVGFERELSGRENIMLSGLLMGYTEKDIRDRMASIITYSGIGKFIDMPVKTYSSGMYAKLAFSIGAIMRPEVLLIDEVLSVGDLAFRRKSNETMRELIEDRSRTVVIVSHSSIVRDLCDEVIWLEDGKVRKIGAADEIMQEYMEENGK